MSNSGSEESKVHRYNAVLPNWIWNRIQEIADREGWNALFVLTTALKLFFDLYEAAQKGKEVTVDGHPYPLWMLREK